MHAHTHTHTQIYNAQEEAEMKFSCILLIPELGKVWHGLSTNQGVAGEHDE
jgi:hypothetical protein